MISQVVYFVSDPTAVATWWSSVAEVEIQHEGEYVWVMVGDVEVGFHPADDEKNPPGASTVAYFAVSDLACARARLLNAGATAHRGPLVISPTRAIAQVRDPFGNVIGLDGP